MGRLGDIAEDIEKAVHGQPSSTIPLQSSSRPLHVSGAGTQTPAAPSMLEPSNAAPSPVAPSRGPGIASRVIVPASWGNSRSNPIRPQPTSETRPKASMAVVRDNRTIVAVPPWSGKRARADEAPSERGARRGVAPHGGNAR